MVRIVHTAHFCQLGTGSLAFKKTGTFLVRPTGPSRRKFSASFSILVREGRTFVR